MRFPIAPCSPYKRLLLTNTNTCLCMERPGEQEVEEGGVGWGGMGWGGGLSRCDRFENEQTAVIVMCRICDTGGQR